MDGSGQDPTADRRFLSDSDSHTALSTPQNSVWQGWHSYTNLLLLGAQWEEKRPCLPFQKLSLTQNLLTSPSWACSMTTECFPQDQGVLQGKRIGVKPNTPTLEAAIRELHSSADTACTGRQSPKMFRTQVPKGRMSRNPPSPDTTQVMCWLGTPIWHPS